jgi:hypothetical protein
MTGGPALSAAEGERVWYRFGEEREMGRGPFRDPGRSAAGGPFSFSNSFPFSFLFSFVKFCKRIPK